VILAAVIGTFVLGLGGSVQQTAPQASFTFDYDQSASGTTGDFGSSGNDGLLTITHDGGDSVEAQRLFVSGGTVGSASDWTNGGFTSGDAVSAGDSITANINNGDTIRVTWESQNGENTATLARFSGPNA
jgi:FlaG/FlaF family flagellin (archaellin)